MPSKGQGSYISGVTQDCIAAGIVHVQLIGKWCEAKWESLTVFGMTQCFTMNKQRSLWSTWCQRLRSLKPVQVIASSGLSETHARAIYVPWGHQHLRHLHLYHPLGWYLLGCGGTKQGKKRMMTKKSNRVLAQNHQLWWNFLRKKANYSSRGWSS